MEGLKVVSLTWHRGPPSYVYCTLRDTSVRTHYRVQSLHRTHSLDIAILLKGEITLLLDNGEKVVLKEGDTLLQRGTRHGWKNESATEWTRIMFVLLGVYCSIRLFDTLFLTKPFVQMLSLSKSAVLCCPSTCPGSDMCGEIRRHA